MGLHRRLRDEQRRRDLGVRRAARHQPQHLVLAVGQLVEPGRVAYGRRDDAPVAVEQSRRYSRIEPRATAGDRPHGRDQLLGRGILQHEARSARLDRAPQDLVLTERGEHEHVERIVQPSQLRRRGDAVETGHPHIHQDDVRMEGGQLRDRLPAVGILSDDLEAVGRREDSRQPGADDGLVVDDRGSDHRLPLSSAGSTQRTRQPSGVGPAANSPPSAVARSCIPISP
jgi:hypothetical protein